MVEVGEWLEPGEKRSSWIMESEFGELYPAKSESSPRILRQYGKAEQYECWHSLFIGDGEDGGFGVVLVSQFLSWLSI
jgi:hypothetical protein